MEINKLYKKDCLEYMKILPDKSVDLIIADPPYFQIVKNDWDNSWKNKEEWIEWCVQWTKECYRILKDDSLMYVWGAVGKNNEHPFLEYLLEVEKKTDFNFINWITMRNFRIFGNSKHFPFGRQECLVFRKGDKHTYNKQYSDFEGTNRLGNPKLVSNIWLDCKDVSLYNKKNAHPTEKPKLSSERIILSSTNEEDIDYIPFCGSGIDIEVCIENNRKWIATEINDEYIEMIKNRINNNF